MNDSEVSDTQTVSVSAGLSNYQHAVETFNQHVSGRRAENDAADGDTGGSKQRRVSEHLDIETVDAW